MTYRVELTLRSKRDLSHIYLKINASQSSDARDWFNGLEDAILSLSEFPARHPVTPENASLRHLLYASQSYVYRVIFTIDDVRKTVTVIHIRHGSRKPL